MCFLIFTPKLGEDFHPFWRAYFSIGSWFNHQLENHDIQMDLLGDFSGFFGNPKAKDVWPLKVERASCRAPGLG